jgi:hypothetical protein
MERRLLIDVPMHFDVAEENRRKLIQGVAAGTIATILMTALLVAAPAFVGERVPEVAARATATLRAHPTWVLVALAVHLAYGALAGALYVAGARRVTIASGLFFGLGLWGVAAAVYAPLFGLGFVASHQPALAALTLPAHLLYGGTLGALAPRGEIVQPIDDRLPLTFADA